MAKKNKKTVYSVEYLVLKEKSFKTKKEAKAFEKGLNKENFINLNIQCNE